MGVSALFFQERTRPLGPFVFCLAPSWEVWGAFLDSRSDAALSLQTHTVATMFDAGAQFAYDEDRFGIDASQLGLLFCAAGAGMVAFQANLPSGFAVG